MRWNLKLFFVFVKKTFVKNYFVKKFSFGKSFLMLEIAAFASQSHMFVLVVAPLTALQSDLICRAEEASVNVVNIATCRDLSRFTQQLADNEPLLGGLLVFNICLLRRSQSVSHHDMIVQMVRRGALLNIFVDEVALILSWSSFRSELLMLRSVVSAADVPVIALSATAPPPLRATVMSILNLNQYTTILVRYSPLLAAVDASLSIEKAVVDNVAGLTSVVTDNVSLSGRKLFVLYRKKDVQFVANALKKR